MLFEQAFRKILKEDLLAAAGKSFSASNDSYEQRQLANPKDPIKQRTETSSLLKKRTNKVEQRPGEHLDPTRDRAVDNVLTRHTNNQPLNPGIIDYIRDKYKIDFDSIKQGDERYLNSKTDTYITTDGKHHYLRNKPRHQ